MCTSSIILVYERQALHFWHHSACVYCCFRQEQNLGDPGILFVGDEAPSSTRIARQQSTTGRQDTEQNLQQSALHVESMKEASQPAVKLLLDARGTASDGASSPGKISIATETWLDRATAKAKASMRARDTDSSE